MAIQTINLGNYANDGTGDDLRTAFTKVNANFSLLDAEANIIDGENLGTGAGIFVQAAAAKLQFKSLTSTDNTVTITESVNSIDLAASSILNSDTSPTLGANLNLNGYNIYGSGDVQSTIYSLSVPTLQYLMSTILESNVLAVDMGSFSAPTGYETNTRGYPLDMNGTYADGFAGTPPVNQLNFGEFSAADSASTPEVIDGGDAAAAF